MPDTLSQTSLIGLLEHWSAAGSTRDAFDTYAKTVDEFGYDQISYVDMAEYISRGRMSDEVDPEERGHLTTFDTTWTDYYIDKDYGPVDPVLAWAVSARRACTWAEAEQTTELTSTQKTLLREGEEGGLNNGFFVPLRGPNGQLSALFVASSISERSSVEAFQVSSLLGYHFHNIAATLRGEGGRGHFGKSLTRREREFLHWCAEGKSNWAIGEILGISEHSVKFHVQNIFKKLDANSRIAAVVKAIRIGLIQP